MLIQNIQYMTVTDDGKWMVEEGDILIKDNKIDSIGNVECDEKVEKLDGKGMLALPGLVNGHQHTPMSLLRCYSDDVTLMTWLNKKMLPLEMKMNDEDRYYGALLSMAEMIKSGTTSYADMYIGIDTIGEAAVESGIRAVIARGLIAMDSDYEGRLKEAGDVVDRWHGKGNGRITTMIAPHSPYMCPPDFLKAAVRLSTEKNVPLHIHLAETKDEEKMIQERYGLRPVEYLRQAGVFDRHVLLAHGVHFSDEDYETLKNVQGGIIHNPVSNAKLGCGISDVKRLMETGVKVGLGTDGPASASSLDLFLEMKAASWFQKLKYEEAAVLSAHDVLTMATQNGADILGIGSEVGSLTVGKKADILLMDMNKLHLTPSHEPANLLVYSATGQDVDTVIIDGKIVMRGRELKTIDEEKVMANAKERTKELLQRL
ncbi:N-ethylammeline chlorohydrolase [Fictibacillus phosphorivorans]|uniref:5-methylthioadenosine/S-adenosylhomocysteine deaminase n=1 Tax=Fictibacillus phosphorivorans TaxID=1221500 RepID=A0A165MXS9_9BACL|nr:amidohydrolase [Fictibacillus phosphorivorans]KZE63850.1 N-ethylammeline chlorohydrolase [Fictibacillus phosphorivorans]